MSGLDIGPDVFEPLPATGLSNPVVPASAIGEMAIVGPAVLAAVTA